MWIHKTAILARIFDRTPREIFDDGVFTLASFGAMVQVKAHKASL